MSKDQRDATPPLTREQIEALRPRGVIEDELNEHLDRLCDMALATLVPSAVGQPSRWHDRLGSMIDQLGHPDYSLRELVEGLRQIRDEMLPALQSTGGETPKAIDLARASELLLRYAAVVRDCHAGELERFDYLPEIEDAAANVLAAARLAQSANELRIPEWAAKPPYSEYDRLHDQGPQVSLDRGSEE